MSQTGRETEVEHFSDDDFMRFSFDSATCDRRAEIEAHLETCSQCLTIVDFMRAADEALGDEDVWELTSESASLRSFRLLRRHSCDLS